MVVECDTGEMFYNAAYLPIHTHPYIQLQKEAMPQSAGRRKPLEECRMPLEKRKPQEEESPGRRKSPEESPRKNAPERRGWEPE